MVLYEFHITAFLVDVELMLFVILFLGAFKLAIVVCFTIGASQNFLTAVVFFGGGGGWGLMWGVDVVRCCLLTVWCGLVVVVEVVSEKVCYLFGGWALEGELMVSVRGLAGLGLGRDVGSGGCVGRGVLRVGVSGRIFEQVMGMAGCVLGRVLEGVGGGGVGSGVVSGWGDLGRGVGRRGWWGGFVGSSRGVVGDVRGLINFGVLSGAGG
ncbi:hypothetical protein Tco_0940900 [Tanacetum coccineum]|uniref:Uncharacterized protein n=1 Tax=Tanacetum coccineum TaxID=301880 RepID=A0ABQ5DPX2_9ASTR